MSETAKTNEPSKEAVIAVGISKLSAALDAHASQTGSLRSVHKSVEALGVNIPVAKEALRIKKAGNVTATIERLKTLFDYLKIIGIPVEDQQLSLFSVAPALAPIDEKAFEDGLSSGRLGDVIEVCPHDPTTHAYQSWRNGHHKGAAERSAILAMEMAPVVAVSGADDFEGFLEGDEPEEESEEEGEFDGLEPAK